MGKKTLNTTILSALILTTVWTVACALLRQLIVYFIGDSPVIDWVFALILSFGLIVVLKSSITQHKTHLIFEATKQLFALMCKEDNKKHGDKMMFDLPTSVFRVEPSKARALRAIWFHRMPKTILYNRVCFDTSASYDKMIQSSRFIEENEIEAMAKSCEFGDVFDITGIEFVFIGHSRAADVYGLGNRAAKFIMESALNENTPFTSWAFGFHMVHGVCLRYLELPASNKLIA